jgi:hypothetical protein
VIAADFYGSDGGAALRNVGGSFYDFTAERFSGTSKEVLTGPPDEWGGRAAADGRGDWRRANGFDPEAEHLVDVARVLDRIYGR